jgi:hypothetical protein
VFGACIAGVEGLNSHFLSFMSKQMNAVLRKAALVTGVIAIAIAISSPGRAQMTTATVSGTVTDATGAVIPTVKVTVTNTATGVTRSTLTDEAGRFVVPQLSPGPYEITSASPGLALLVRKGITLEIGQEVNLPLAMTPGAVSEQVTVTSEAPLVSTGTSSVAGVVDEKRIVNLPLNGRDFSQLPLLTPGVTANRNTSTSTTMGYATKVSMGGSRPDVTAWMLDGTNIKGITNFGTPASVAGVMMGVDAVQEFQVLVSNYSAEFGGTSGGVINMVTKSGTNKLHGTAYEYLRNSALDARNFFDSSEKPAFKRNQFGASFGAPIKKDKTFFFSNYEGIVQRQGLTTVAIVPDANAHRGLIPGAGGALQQVAVAPSIQPYLDLWPLANGPGVGGGLATLYAPTNRPVEENYFMARVDHQLTERQSIFARFTYDQGTLTTPDALPITNSTVDTRTRYYTLQYQNVFTQRFLASTRLAYNRTNLLSNNTPTVSVPASAIFFNSGLPPQLSFPGVTGFGPTTTAQFVRLQNLYQFQENLQYVRSAHTMKFGADIQHIGYNQYRSAPGNNASFGWSSLQAFLQDSRLQSFSATAEGADRSQPRSWVQYVYGVYFQDDWRLRRNVTLNLGLRYEPFSVPTEKYGRFGTVKDWTKDTVFLTGQGGTPLWKDPSKKNFSPRVGFAWDVTGDGKTAVRGGFGIFFVDLLNTYYGTPGQLNPPFFAQVTTVQGNLASARADVAQASPAALSPILNPNSSKTLIDWNLKPSYEMKYNLSVERQLGGDVSVVAGYLSGRGVHLWRTASIHAAPSITVDGRPFVAAGTPAINPNTGQGGIRYSDTQSFYNALLLEVKKRFSRSFQLQTAYTFAKNVDDGTAGGVSGVGNDGSTSQPYNPKADRGLSGLHQAHTLVINGAYMLPSPIKSGLLSRFVDKWQMSSILTAHSGEPFTVFSSGFNAPNLVNSAGQQHPDLVAGRTSSNIVTGNPDQYFDPTAFVLPAPGFYGNAGRNILIGPGLFNFDLSLKKSIPLGGKEGQHVEFRAEAFNLLNHSNFAIPANTQVLNATTRSYVAGAGKITKTVTSSRQLQFSIKVTF